jgi:hypothetical protein
MMTFQPGVIEIVVDEILRHPHRVPSDDMLGLVRKIT